MTFSPEEYPPGSSPVFQDCSGGTGAWKPMYKHACTYGPEVFAANMMNLIRNPNLNSKWLFRGDILYDRDLDTDPHQGPNGADSAAAVQPRVHNIQDMPCKRIMVRKMIPRNNRRDAPLDQTCTFHQSVPTEDSLNTLVIYVPHVSTPAEIPFYHPKVGGVAQLHEWNRSTKTGTISIHFLPFPEETGSDPKLQRIAYHLLEILNKHGHGMLQGYVKRVNHDVVVPQTKFQDRYSELKNKYARTLVDSWAETTDPSKHVFEDLGIAAFLIELWADMYRDGQFPGFVDIGCGNGLLVYILCQEGYAGWGFDARERRSWSKYKSSSTCSPSGSSLERRLLLPSIITQDGSDEDAIDAEYVHDGIFPEGTFIISNHADELTPWTPILATLSRCPFIMIPCCSHDLTGSKFRAPAPRDKSKPKSTFASLVDWVSQIAEDCGWEVETEMLRIPSTRNTGLVGRRRTAEADQIDVDALLVKYGGVGGYYDTVRKLLKSAPRGH